MLPDRDPGDRSRPLPGGPAPDRGLSLPARVAIGALALFGAIVVAQWLIGALIGLVKFALVVVICVALAAWIVQAKSRR